MNLARFLKIAIKRLVNIRDATYIKLAGYPALVKNRILDKKKSNNRSLLTVC